ncbi:unnamed protein product [Arabidopsis arenosa]|uniref:Replication protein A 70 kDa DNA-binding subunit B/D first OB fold domain-containing protein n=1 Tax=Arabidopsis arenosa TaxID=38785 RepID=A0A8S2AIG8_ARAAE|nr:unnamed protein product [Arabidopsis arenosa]
MALINEPSSSVAPLDETKPWKIKVKLMRIWKEGLRKRAANSIDMVLLESSESSRIHITIDKAFSEWIKDINDGDDHADIDIPENASPIECPDPIEEIVSQVYGDSFREQSSYSYCRDTVILCHTQSDVDQINAYMLSQIPGEDILSHSDDCLVPSLKDNSRPGHYIFATTQPGHPPRMLELIPKMHMFSGKDFVTPMRRTQYPFTLAFAMTVDQSRGQAFSKVGLYLPKQVLCPPGQRYLAISKVKAATGLTQVLITEEGEKPHVEAQNVVLKKLFWNV